MFFVFNFAILTDKYGFNPSHSGQGEKSPERAQNQKIGNNLTNMSIWSLKIGQT